MVRALTWLIPSIFVSAESDVAVLTKDTFDAFIKDTERAVVMFFAPWCGHCKKLEPEFEAAATELKEQGMESRLAKVDATEEKELAKRFDVNGYPTLHYFVKGESSEYNGPREKDGIVTWIRSREAPTLMRITDDKVDAKKEDRSVDFILVGHLKENSVRYKVMLAAAEKLRDAEKSSSFLFYYVPLPKGKDPKKDASLEMINHKTNATIKYDVVWTAEKCFKWVIDSAYGVVSLYNDKLHTVAFMEELFYSSVFVAVYEKEKESLLSELSVLAPKHLKYKFCYASLEDVKSDETWALKESAVVVLQANNKRYIQSGIQKLQDFISDVENKKAKRHFKSADGGADMDNGVVVLTGKTFEKVALDPKKEVFVEFYAPWCKHCQELAPKWEELAAKVKNLGLSEKVVIAKFDADANESEQEVSGFPTLVFFPASKRSFAHRAKYEGDRELDPLFDFLVEQSAHMEGLEEKPKKTGKKYSMVERELQKKREKAKEL